MTEPWPQDRPLTVGVLYPPEWYGDPEGFEGELETLRAMDPRIRIVALPYEESHDLRTARKNLTPEEIAAKAPELSPAEREAFAGIDVAIGLDLPADLGSVAPRLQWFHALGSGTDHLLTSGLLEAGGRLTNSAGANAVAIAEFALARVLAHWKRFDELAAAQVERTWAALFGHQLAGSTIGLLGLGAINGAVATRAKALGVHVIGVRRRGPDGPAVDGVDEIHPPGALLDVLPRCDAVIAAVPDTPETRGLMDAAAFAAMAPGAFFVNVGRGTLVGEEALVDALRTGHLGGAALDVTVTEPLPEESPLWDAPNLALSGHCATAPGAMFVTVHQIFADNLRRFLAGEGFRNQVAP